MATPQLENGHIRIANELFEAILRFPFNKRERLIVMSVMRLTYGYNLKSNVMRHSQIGEICGIARHHVQEILLSLREKKVINVTDSGQFSHGKLLQNIGLNKNYDEWLTSPKSGLVPNQDVSGLVPKNKKTSPESGLELVPKNEITSPKMEDIYKNSKDNKKDNKNILAAQTISGPKKSGKGTRLPETWKLPEEWLSWTKENTPAINPNIESQKFHNHWLAKTGKDATKMDWFATWRNWCFRAVEIQSRNSHKQSPASRFMENLKNA